MGDFTARKKEVAPSLGWILVVDDDQQVTQNLVEGLAKLGYRAVHASSVAEARTKLSKQTFDCVLVDLVLAQGGDGTSVISFMRNDHPGNKYTPILVISGSLDVDVIKRIRSQVSDILVKPFSLGVLVSRIRNILGQSSAAA